MEARDYQRLASRTANADLDFQSRLVQAALGLTGEAGEFADEVKKIAFHGHPPDLERLAKELGDVAWYLAECCTALRLDLGVVMDVNVAKLRRRYPDGFSTEASLARQDVKGDE